MEPAEACFVTYKTNKHMKTILSILSIALASTIALGQNSGVYLTASDFENGKLTYGIDCAKEKHKIKLHEFLGKDYITVIHNGQSNNLKKKEIFGYQDCDGTISRLGIDKHYQVINPSEKILLYKIEIPPAKNQPKTTIYYFSNSASGEIQELTHANLKKHSPTITNFMMPWTRSLKLRVTLCNMTLFTKSTRSIGCIQIQ